MRCPAPRVVWSRRTVLSALTEAEAAEADGHATAAREAHEVWVKRLADLNHADRQAREARRQAETNLAAASRAQTRAETERATLDARLDTLREAARRHAEQVEAAIAELTGGGGGEGRARGSRRGPVPSERYAGDRGCGADDDAGAAWRT
jgi:hypothetical protein